MNRWKPCRCVLLRTNELIGASCFRLVFFVTPEEPSNLDFGDAFSFRKKCGDHKEENGGGARVDEKGPAESDGLDKVAVGEDGCKYGKAGHSDRQSGHQAAKLLRNIMKCASLMI